MPSSYGLDHIRFLPQGQIKCVSYVTSFCSGMKFCHQTFPQASIDFNGNSAFPSKVKFVPHKLHCSSLHFGESINAVNKRGKRKRTVPSFARKLLFHFERTQAPQKINGGDMLQMFTQPLLFLKGLGNF